jgi:hypothetical protein
VGLTVVARLLAGLALVAGCGCPLISQEVFVGEPDPQLQTLIDQCKAHVPATDSPCSMMSFSPTQPAIPCGCEPLCQRVLRIIDQFKGAEDLQACSLQNAADGGVAVSVTYRPSSCP